MQNFLESLDRLVSASGDRLLANLPQVLQAAALLALGWLLAFLVRMATVRSSALLDALMVKVMGPSRWRAGRFARSLGNLAFWVVLLFFVTAAAQTLGLQIMATWLARLVEQLPSVAAGLLIVVAGYVLSGMVAELIRTAATSLANPQRSALARVAQGAILLIALLMGADQIGLKVTWLAMVILVLLVCLLGGVALAVGLGARAYVANLIGAHYLAQTLAPGQWVRIGEQRGQVVEISATSLILDSPEGRAILPGRVYLEETVIVLAHPGGGDRRE